jgi:hypothetical protein
MTRRLWALTLALAPLAGCHGNTDFWLPPNDLLPMAAMDDRVAFVDKTSETAFLLDPADPTLTPRQVKVGKAPVAAVKRNGANQLLVLCKGDRGSSATAAVAPELDVIDATATEPDTYFLDYRLDALAQSDDGRFLVLYHSPSGGSQGDSALYNPNEMAVVDLQPPDGSSTAKVTSKSIRSLGGVPADIRFSPDYGFSLGPRRLAVVLSQNYVTIIDLNNPDQTEISVPLCPTTTGCNLSPVQVVFDPTGPICNRADPTKNAPYATIFVRVSGAKDIYQIALTDLYPCGQPPSQPLPAGSNDFSASLSMLAVGATPTDMAVYPTADGARLAVTSADGKRLVVIDPKTSETTTVMTPIPSTQIIPFAVLPQTQPTQALLVDAQFGSMSVVFVDLNQVETTGGLAMTDYPLGAAAAEVHPLLDQGIVVLVAKGFYGSAALTVVDLASRSFSPQVAGSSHTLPTFEMRSPSRLWSAVDGSDLFYLNLSDRKDVNGTVVQPRLAKGETWLDQTITGIMPLAVTSSDGTRYVVVSHNDPDRIGNVTVLDAEAPDRAQARTARGFLLSKYLEREQP